MVGTANPSPDAPLGRRERRKREIRDRLLESARTLFDQKGFGATTVDEICARADVAQKTFFNYFPTKHHVVREIAEAFLDDIRDLVAEARRQPGSTVERIHYLFRRAAEEAALAGPMHKELTVEVIRAVHVDGSGPRQARTAQEAFSELIDDGVAAGDLTTAHDATFLTEMVVGVFTAILLNWASLENYSLDEHLEEAARFLERAISP